MKILARYIIFFSLAFALMLGACAQSVSTGSNNPTVAVTNNGENNSEGGVEAALVTYSDSTQGFVIGHPSTWTQDPSFSNGVKFIGGDEWMTLEFVTPPVGSDPLTYAQNDVPIVTAAFPGFKLLDIHASTEVKNAVVMGFTSNGKSAVTGKTFIAHNERYYIMLADGRIAILTVFSPDNHYDREGVRDIALTFKLTQ